MSALCGLPIMTKPLLAIAALVACSGSWAESDSEMNISRQIYDVNELQIIQNPVPLRSCTSGVAMTYSLSGVIGPDRTFAMTKLLDRNATCRDHDGNVVVAPLIYLNSQGGSLDDGYALGREFRRLGVTVAVGFGSQCASSRAVAFLGGKNRFVAKEGRVLLYAPYHVGRNEVGGLEVNCDIGVGELAKLRDYYREMTDKETSDRLYERTMWYCSAENGWVVKGGAAAELYGLASKRCVSETLIPMSAAFRCG